MGVAEFDKNKQKEVDGTGPIQDFLSMVAKKYDVWVVGGTIPLAADDERKVRAACLVYNNAGERVGRYDKIHLFDVSVPNTNEEYRESNSIEAGDIPFVIDTPFGKLGVAVCYDLRFPEISRNGMVDHKSAKFDVLIYVANWPERRNSHWKSLLQARAIENQCYVVGVNRVGVDGKELTYSGDSAVYNANGSMISNIEPFQEIVQIVELDYKDLTEFRSQLAFLKDV